MDLTKICYCWNVVSLVNSYGMLLVDVRLGSDITKRRKSIPTLHFDLIPEILSRLPVKSLLQF
jgi:hypothetical protein